MDLFLSVTHGKGALEGLSSVYPESKEVLGSQVGGVISIQGVASVVVLSVRLSVHWSSLQDTMGSVMWNCLAFMSVKERQVFMFAVDSPGPGMVWQEVRTRWGQLKDFNFLNIFSCFVKRGLIPSTFFTSRWTLLAR